MSLTHTPLSPGWDAKVVTHKKVTHIELRKTLGDGANILLVVARNGYNLTEKGVGRDSTTPDQWGQCSKGNQVRMSLNNSARMTLKEFREIDREVNYAYEMLWEYEKEPGEQS